MDLQPAVEIALRPKDRRERLRELDKQIAESIAKRMDNALTAEGRCTVQLSGREMRLAKFCKGFSGINHVDSSDLAELPILVGVKAVGPNGGGR